MSLLCTLSLFLTAASMWPVAQTLFYIPEITLSYFILFLSSFTLSFSLSLYNYVVQWSTLWWQALIHRFNQWNPSQRKTEREEWKRERNMVNQNTHLIVNQSTHTKVSCVIWISYILLVSMSVVIVMDVLQHWRLILGILSKIPL